MTKNKKSKFVLFLGGPKIGFDYYDTFWWAEGEPACFVANRLSKRKYGNTLGTPSFSSPWGRSAKDSTGTAILPLEV